MATSNQPKRSRLASGLDDSRHQAPGMRSPATPAYYLGRPAWMWTAVFGRPRPRA
jgi:hypothetical protein